MFWQTADVYYFLVLLHCLLANKVMMVMMMQLLTDGNNFPSPITLHCTDFQSAYPLSAAHLS